MLLRGTLIALVLGPGLMVHTGCSDTKYLYQSRYIPRPSELRWDKEHEQLPWRPPALAPEDHYARNQRAARPRFPAELRYSVETDKNLRLQEPEEE